MNDNGLMIFVIKQNFVKPTLIGGAYRTNKTFTELNLKMFKILVYKTFKCFNLLLFYSYYYYLFARNLPNV